MPNKPGALFFLSTQGCKVNQYETQALRESWLDQGLVETDKPGLADIVCINSCAVTERAVRDLGKLVRRFASLAPKPWIVVTGCAVEADRHFLLSLPGVDEIIAQRDKVSPGPKETTGFPDLHIRGYQRARAVLKVQDGCSHGCTYCIIPLTRGPSVSREPKAVIAEARRLLQAGIREISLCGVNLRHYGRDLSPPTDFWTLLAAVESALIPEWAGRARLRLGSLEPADLGAKALQVMAESALLCPHVHISLQNGSPEILRRMGRGHYAPQEVCDFVNRLRTIWPIFGLGADIIAGFPGESEAHFAQTLDLIHKLPLSYAHIFPYSERPNTPAASFSGAVPEHVRRERAKTLRQTVDRKHSDFVRALLGQGKMHVALENDGTGMNEFYVECTIENAPRRSRELIPVTAVEYAQGTLKTRILKEGA